VPSSDEILAGLSEVAHRWIAIAIAWHIVLGVALAAVATGGWRPSNRTAAIASAAPLASVSIASASSAGSPFNAIVLGIAAIALVGIGWRITPAPIDLRGEPRWPLAIGLAMIGLGWVYPHFLEGEAAWLPAIGSPIGLVPCPSIAIVLGLGLCGRGLASRAWAVSVAALGLFYGVFGALRLGVWIDLGLVAGALALLALASRSAERWHAPQRRAARSPP
jgi:hypothetical protein